MRAKVDTCFWRHLDGAITGLDDFGGRSYDPALGQFVSADTYDAGGLNRYAYVGGNPETQMDPSGHILILSDGNGNHPLLDRGTRHKVIMDWPDYGDTIQENYTKYNNLPPFLSDHRNIFHRLSRAYNDVLEYTDGQALMNYFGLSVTIQDPKDGYLGTTSDYVMGMDTIFPAFGFPGAKVLMLDPTPVELYAPTTSDFATAVFGAQRKAYQAPILMVDISHCAAVDPKDPAQMQAFADNIIDPTGNNGPKRVLIVYNGVVIADEGSYGPHGYFGPPAMGPHMA